MNTTDLLTKLLAKENITILRQNVPTASFDINKRILRLPILLNLNTSEEFMMSLHEVGHALYTDESYLEYIRAEEDKRMFGSYMNVLEDIRIEKLIKEYYPGVRKDFYSGYNSLNERDFFGINAADTSKLSLIDRINIHFKVGFRAGVRFTKEERELVLRAERTETLEEVYKLALDVYNMAAKQKREETQQLSELSDVFVNDDSDEEDEYDFDDYDADYYDEPEEGEEEEYTRDFKRSVSGAGSTDHESDVPDAITQRNFNRSVSEITEDPTKEIVYVVPGISGYVYETSYKDIFKIMDEEIEKEEERIKNLEQLYPGSRYDHRFNVPYYENQWLKFRGSNNKAVAHLFKEFEMRKAARRYTRTQTSPSGSLNMRKIHEYRTSGDIFAKMQSVYDEKNHSFLMLLDWSGSMDEHLSDSVGQIITLASFCRRAKLPFQVIAFRDRARDYNNVLEEQYKRVPDGINGLTSCGSVEFLNLLDSSMNSSDFDKMSKMLYCRYISRTNRFSLTSTPLVQAVSWVYNYLPTFQKNASTEKTTLIVVTDGEANGTYVAGPQNNMLSHYRMSTAFARCKYTGKIYNYSIHSPSEQMHTILTMIGNAFPEVSRIGFFVSDRRGNSLRNFNAIYGQLLDTRQISDDMRKKYYCEYPTPVYDKLFVIPANAEEMSIDLNTVTSKMSSSQIARSINKAVGNALNSRVVLSKFIEAIS